MISSLISAYKSLTSGVWERDHCFVFGICLFVLLETINYLLVTFVYIYIVHLIRNLGSLISDLFLWSGCQSEYCINPQYIVNPEQSSDFLNISEDFILVYCEIFGFIRFIWCLSFPMSREFSILQLSNI